MVDVFSFDVVTSVSPRDSEIKRYRDRERERYRDIEICITLGLNGQAAEWFVVQIHPGKTKIRKYFIRLD